MKILQDIIFDDIDTIKTISIDYIIKSHLLIPEQITNDLDIIPTRAWAKNEKYLSKVRNIENDKIEERWYERPWGIWAVNTSKLIKSKVLEEHMELILKKLLPKIDILKSYLNDNATYNICFYIFCNILSESGGIMIENRYLSQMSLLSHYTEIRFLMTKSEEE